MESYFQRNRDTEGKQQKGSEREQCFHMQTQASIKWPVQTHCVEIPWKHQDWLKSLEVKAKVEQSPNESSSIRFS